MGHHQELFDRVRKNPGMWVTPVTFDSVANFVVGCDTANDGRLLRGFREWLQLRGARGSNLDWTGLVLNVAFPDSESPLDNDAAQRHAIDTLFDLLAEFDEVVSQRDGLLSIYVAFDRRSRRGGAVHFARSSSAATPGAQAVDALLRDYAELPFPPSWFAARVREIVSAANVDDVMTALPDDVRELAIAWVQETFASEPPSRRPALSRERAEREQVLVDWVRTRGRLHWPRPAGEPNMRDVERRLWLPEPALGAMKREPERILMYMEPTIVDAVIENLPDDIRDAVLAWARETFAEGKELPTPRPWRRARRGAEDALVDWLRRNERP